MKTTILGAIVLLMPTPVQEVEPRPVRGPAQAVAVIVHPDNPVKDVSLSELSAMLRLDRQFWPNGKRIVLLMRPKGGVERSVLLERIYRMDDRQLHKHWINRLFAGKISAIPSTVRSTSRTVKAVARSPNAISVVLAGGVTKGVRALTIGGKTPGAVGYPLVEMP